LPVYAFPQATVLSIYFAPGPRNNFPKPTGIATEAWRFLQMATGKTFCMSSCVVCVWQIFLDIETTQTMSLLLI